MRSPLPTLSRRATVVALGVLAGHASLLWLLEHGRVRQAAEVVVPVQVMVELLDSTPAQSAARAAVPAPAAALHRAPPVPQAAPEARPVPVPVAVEAAAPQPVVPQPVPAERPAEPSMPLTQVGSQVAASVPPSAAASPAAPAFVPPASDAAYLNNPKPVYPAMSRRLGEQGRAVVRVYINAAGQAEQVELKESSGYERLDRVALTTVKRWRFVPAKRGQEPVAMWWNVPITFALND